MKIKSLTYKNYLREWEFDEVQFDNLTLLVGISGVGKTQILKSIIELKKIAFGEQSNGIEWEINFESSSDINFKWIGKFEVIEKINDSNFIFSDEDEEKKREKPKILFEKLYKNDILIIDRNAEITLFKGNKMPKFDASESIIKILKEEDEIKPAYEAFQKVIFRDHTTNETSLRIRRPDFVEKAKEKIKNLADLRNSNFDTFDKFLLVKSIDSELYDEIKERFIDVFNQVEDLSIEPNTEDYPFAVTTVRIKEHGVNKWIDQEKISSGMMRTLRHICEMFLRSDGTLILIDEFENSLGLNCINVLSNDLLSENRRLQFIATSHHPYVIDKIPHTCWKIVTRYAGKIHVYGTEKFELEKSSHENFVKVANLPQYREGIGYKS